MRLDNRCIPAVRLMHAMAAGDDTEVNAVATTTDPAELICGISAIYRAHLDHLGALSAFDGWLTLARLDIDASTPLLKGPHP